MCRSFCASELPGQVIFCPNDSFIIGALNLCMLFRCQCITRSSFVQKLAGALPELALVVFHTHGPYSGMPLYLFMSMTISVDVNSIK